MKLYGNFLVAVTQHLTPVAFGTATNRKLLAHERPTADHLVCYEPHAEHFLKASRRVYKQAECTTIGAG